MMDKFLIFSKILLTSFDFLILKYDIKYFI